MKFSDFQTEILSLAFPNRMPANLVPKRRHHLKNGLGRLQELFVSLRKSHKDTHPTDDLYLRGMATIAAPQGHLVAVRAVRNDDPDERYAPYPYILAGRQNIIQLSNEYLEAGGGATDPDTGKYHQMIPAGGRGFFAVDRGSLMVFPCPLDPWELQIEWDGIKRTWADNDDICLEENLKAVLVAWCEAWGESDLGNIQSFSTKMEAYALLLRSALRDQLAIENPAARDRYLVHNTPPSYRAWAAPQSLHGPSTKITT